MSGIAGIGVHYIFTGAHYLECKAVLRLGLNQGCRLHFWRGVHLRREEGELVLVLEWVSRSLSGIRVWRLSLLETQPRSLKERKEEEKKNNAGKIKRASEACRGSKRERERSMQTHSVCLWGVSDASPNVKRWSFHVGGCEVSNHNCAARSFRFMDLWRVFA